MLGNYGVAEQVAASQGGLSSMNLVWTIEVSLYVKNLLWNFSKGIFKIDFIQFSENNI
jgi:hypothetical protein